MKRSSFARRLFWAGLASAAAAAPAWAHNGARLEPPDGTVLHGAQAGASSVALWKRQDWSRTSIPEYEEAAGKPPLLILHYVQLGDPAPALRGKLDSVADTSARGRIPVIGIPFRAPLRSGESEGPQRDLTGEIAAGKWDEKITTVARRLAASGKPIFVRPGYEFGGGGDGAIYDPKQYPAAFRHFVEVLRAAGAGNVAVVWHHGNAPDPLSWYPGDDVVDWWGMSVFQHPRDEHRRFAAEAVRHRKPLLIAEASPRDTGSAGPKAWESWYEPFFRLVQSNPGIKGFCYLNNSWRGWSSWKDSRIEANPSLLARYRKELSDPRYIHASGDGLIPRFYGPLFAEGEGAPRAELTGRASARVTWETAAIAEAPADCRGRVDYAPAGGGDEDRGPVSTLLETSTGSHHVLSLDGLLTGRRYRIRLLCVTAGGLEIGGPMLTIEVPAASDAVDPVDIPDGTGAQ